MCDFDYRIFKDIFSYYCVNLSLNGAEFKGVSVPFWYKDIKINKNIPKTLPNLFKETECH